MHRPEKEPRVGRSSRCPKCDTCSWRMPNCPGAPAGTGHFRRPLVLHQGLGDRLQAWRAGTGLLWAPLQSAWVNISRLITPAGPAGGTAPFQHAAQPSMQCMVSQKVAQAQQHSRTCRQGRSPGGSRRLQAATIKCAAGKPKALVSRYQAAAGTARVALIIRCSLLRAPFITGQRKRGHHRTAGNTFNLSASNPTLARPSHPTCPRQMQAMDKGQRANLTSWAAAS